MGTQSLDFKIIVLTLLTGCLQDNCDTIETAGLPGIYVYQVNPMDTIEINSNGTYSYYNWRYGKLHMNPGTWTFDSLACRINFANFSFLTDTMKFLNGPPRGNWTPNIQTGDSGLQLIYARDIYKGCYLKINSINDT